MKSINYEGYTVSDDGKVFGKFGKEIGKTNAKGYTYVTINGNQMLRHRLVWIVFVGKIPDGFEIDHIVPLSKGGTDALSNLRLVTHYENCNNENSIENYKESNSKRKKYKSAKEAKKMKVEKHKIWYLKNRDKMLEYYREYYRKYRKNNYI